MCKDALVKSLNAKGYSVIKYPREYIKPLLFLCKTNGSLKELGHLGSFVLGSSPMPLVNENTRAPDISVEHTDKLEIGVGLTFLKDLLQLLGVGGVGLDATFKNAKTIKFTFKDIYLDYIFPVVVGDFLVNSKPNTQSSFFGKMKEKGKTFVINETLKSGKMNVSTYDKNDVQLKIDLSAIKNMVSVSPNVAVSSEDNGSMNFEGNIMLPFAFKAVPTWVEVDSLGKAKFKVEFPSTPAPTIKLAASNRSAGFEVIGQGELVEIIQ